ncbi:MAG TPA: nucleotidyltransferase family protein [Vitreimonas sp.]|nr:nucleotidyltransferase family protein [Vitreimonas sp.]
MLRMVDQTTLAKLRALEPELRREGIASLFVFGSFARGQERRDSDIDLFCDLSPESKLGFGFFGLGDRIAEAVGRPVDLMTRDGLHRLIRDDVAREAIQVF